MTRHAFDLELIGHPEGEGDRLFIWGRMTFGHFSDEFQAPLYDWAPGDYAAQWVEAAQRLVEGAECVVFLTHMVHPNAPYHLGWPAWRVGDDVYIQERLFLAERLSGPFDPSCAEVHAGPRLERSPEGRRVAQWHVKVQDVEDFLKRRRPEGEPTA